MLLTGLVSYLSYPSQDPGMAPPTVAWVLLTSVNTQTCLRAYLIEAIPQLRSPSSQVFLVCVKLTKTSCHIANNRA